MVREKYYEIFEEEYYGILESEFEGFMHAYEGTIRFEEWREKVDILYRKKYKTFAIVDDEICNRLSGICFDLGVQLIDGLDQVLYQENQEDDIEEQSEKLLRRIQRFLDFRAHVIHDLGYPFNIRFQRWEIHKFTREEFSDSEIEMGYNYDAALEHLVNEGYLLKIETGGKEKYDTFQVVPV
tara:strand:+ start:19 stop:564 length:546 start_codon:yes stop_codon:yes gene_type:complete